MNGLQRDRPGRRATGPGGRAERCARLEARLSGLQRIGRIGAWEWDAAAGRLARSPFLRELHGEAPTGDRDDSIDLESALERIHPDDRPRLRGMLESPGPADWLEFDYRVPQPGGPPVRLHARAAVERDAQGRPVRIAGVSRDVTQERQREEARERSFIASVVQAVSDAIVTQDLAGTVTSWNRAAQDLFGHAANEAVGRPAALLVPPERLAEEGNTMERILRGEPIPQFETERVRKDGGRVQVSVSVAPLRDREGRIVGAAQVARDITAQKRAQARQRQAIDEEIRRLDEMSRFRARFINVAAHELKTPLTPIRLQLQLLALHLKGQPGPVQHSLAVLTRSVERLRQLMDDILDAARIQATHLKLRRAPMDLGRVVDEALETYAEVARRVGVRLQPDVAGEVGVLGDHTRLLQVANNLLSNAIKFTPPGGHVEVTLRVEGGWAVLAVHDTGRGLTDGQRRQLFQPFAQVHPELEATTKGSGLGLFIVKAIVEEHGGAIRLDSEGPDRGTTVTVRLPLGHPRPTPLGPPGGPGPAAGRGAPTHTATGPRGTLARPQA